MATAVEQGQQLEHGIERIEKEIETMRVDIAEWESRERECNSLLAELRQSYIEAAGLKVQGKSAPVDTLAKRIDDLKEKSIGFAHVIATKREQLSDLQARLQPLRIEQSERAQQLELAREKEQTDALLAEGEKVLAVRDSAAKKFVEALIQLRSTTYRGEGARRAAFDGAQRLERISNGMRP
jgi:hypothetical protein